MMLPYSVSLPSARSFCNTKTEHDTFALSVRRYYTLTIHYGLELCPVTFVPDSLLGRNEQDGVSIVQFPLTKPIYKIPEAGDNSHDCLLASVPNG